MKAKLLLTLCIAALMAGCASPEANRYYSLATPEVPALVRPPAGQAPQGLRLDLQELPAEVDRIQLLVRDPGQDPAVQVLQHSLWVAPLDEQIRDLLSADVAARLGIPDLRRLPDIAGLSERRIDVRLTRFDLNWERNASLVATWTDQLPGKAPVRVCQAAIQATAGPGVPALVEAQRLALQSLAQLIAQAPHSPVNGLPEPQSLLSFGCT